MGKLPPLHSRKHPFLAAQVPFPVHLRVQISLVRVLGVDLVTGRLLVRAADAIGDLLVLLGREVVAGLLGDEVECCAR